MKRFRLVTLAMIFLALTAGCASHRVAPENDPAALAALRADLRVVGGETTWVTHGKTYELVGRTRSDLLAAQPALDRAAAFYSQIYPRDSAAWVVATIRRAPAPGKPFVSAAPVPPDTHGARVEIVLFDPKAVEEERKKQEAARPGFGIPGADPAAPAIRAWLSARASRLTGTPARADEARGEVGDPRLLAWPVEMIAAAGNEEVIDNDTKSLAAHAEALIPLERYFMMERPATPEMVAGRRGEGGRGESPPEGRGGGGMGGIGGMGGGRGIGGRGMGGRGGMGGGSRGGSSGGSGARTIPLQGPALFTAESAVLGKYFARVSYEVIGEMIDAQIAGKPIDDVFAKRSLGTVLEVDADWKAWLIRRADVLNRG